MCFPKSYWVLYLKDKYICLLKFYLTFISRTCKVFIKWASLIEINWIKFGLIK